MSGTPRFLTALLSFLRPARKVPVQAPPRAPQGTAPISLGQFGADATSEVDPRRLGRVRLGYEPNRDGSPDPGEIVWTWVPFEERDGRGKDRPVVIVAEAKNGTLLAVQLTSKDHTGQGDFVELGPGSWDREGRQSWVNIDRVFRVHPGGVRREAASLDSVRFERVAEALRRRYGWL